MKSEKCGTTQWMAAFTLHNPSSCEIGFDPPPDDPDLVSLTIDCELKSRDEPGAGWAIDAAGRVLSITGANCQLLLEGAQRVDVYFECRAGS